MARPLNSPKDADWYACPSCGAEVRVGSRGCPQCNPGSRRKKWEQEEYMDGVDAGDSEDFDYEDFVKREFGKGLSRLKPDGIKWKWWFTAVVLLALSVWVLIKVLRPLF